MHICPVQCTVQLLTCKSNGLFFYLSVSVIQHSSCSPHNVDQSNAVYPRSDQFNKEPAHELLYCTIQTKYSTITSSPQQQYHADGNFSQSAKILSKQLCDLPTQLSHCQKLGQLMHIHDILGPMTS